jgi:hypothetical protein
LRFIETPASAVPTAETVGLALLRRCHGVGHRSAWRSLVDLVGTIQGLEACGVDLYLDQQAIDTTTPAGKLMFQITPFAEALLRLARKFDT